MDEAFPSPCFSLVADRKSLEPLGEDAGMLSDGSTSFFCLEAGRISSKSTGTPRETRNRRRVRERIQSGGARGGGATSWDHREAERGVRKIDESFDNCGKGWKSSSSGGKRLGKFGSTAEMTSSRLSPSKSGIDCMNVSVERQEARVRSFSFIFDEEIMHIQMVMIVVG